MNENKTMVVGIGSSAGGLEALEIILSRITSSNKITYVITQHLDPKKNTKLIEILSRTTTIPLHMIKNNEEIKSDTIYICPPNYDLIIEKNHFLLRSPSKEAYSSPCINIFFNSLAKEKKDKAIGIILSGAGHDGTEGIKAIKNEGGITIAQKETSAKYPQMPNSAISTNQVDLDLSPEEIASYLQNILKYPSYSFEDDDYSNQANEIYNILIDKTKTDFSDYKTSTIQRRIRRRMFLNKKNTLKEYIEYLKESKEEIFLLHKELLVIVTSLFRDKDAFIELEKNLEKFLLKKDKDEVIRVWVSGCATGQEAYSIAIIFYDLFKKNNLMNKIQIFATDISLEAITIARNATFSQEDLIDVNPDYINKYFIKNNERYKVCKKVRDLIIFSKHDIVKDPPFLNIDLITCRNLLIYFNTSLQKRIFSIFFNILKKDGLLFLGKSESTNNLTNLFLGVDNKSKIFKKDLTATPPSNDKIIYNQKRFISNTMSVKKEIIKKNDKNAPLHDSLAQTILDKYIDNYIIINRKDHIVFTKGELNEYMKLPNGGFTQDIFAFLKDNIRIEIRTGILKARREQDIVKLNIKLEKNKSLQIDILPIVENDINTESLCIIFKENNEKINIDVSDNKELFERYNKLNIKELEQELIETKENLQSTIEELETSNEELQSTNEEFQSSNEELQSSNEELQSTNEELTTVNQEIEEKSKELIKIKTQLEDTNNNLENIINKKTTEIKEINANLKIRNKELTEALELFENTFEQAAVGIAQVSIDGLWQKVNKKLSEITGYSKEDLINTSFKDITHPDDLSMELSCVDKLLKGEIKYYSLNKRYYKKDKSLIWINLTCSLVRKSSINEPNYFISVIEDISLEKEYQQELKNQKEEFKTIFDFANDSIVVIDLNKNILKFNKAFLKFTGYSKEYLLTKNCDDFTILEDRKKSNLAIKKAIKIGYVQNIEKKCLFKEGRIVTVNMSATLLPDKKNILLSLKDMSSLEIMEQQSKLASMGEMIGNIAHQWRQPLSVITMNISGLKLKSDMNGIERADIIECEENITKQANYLSTTIDNFRNFLEKEKMITPVSIIKTIEKTLSISNSSLRSNYVSVILDLKDDIIINGNDNELIEAFINIINNSKDVLISEIKDEAKRLLLISTQQISETQLELKIIDSGGGIKNSNIKKIFEPYFTTKHQSQGTGLGLAISHKIITQRHKGKINVSNENFQYNNKFYTGACFKITFKKI